MEPEKPDQAGWEYKPKSPADSAYPAANDPLPQIQKPASGSVSWTAHEYIAHEHGSRWYLGLVLLSLASSSLMYLLTRDYFATGSVVAVGVIVGLFATRKPKEITYELSESGLQIGEKSYPYSSFQSFSLISEGGISSVSLTPLKRFMPPISIYFTPADQTKIVSVLGNYLPHDERSLDSVERLTRRLRF